MFPLLHELTYVLSSSLFRISNRRHPQELSRLHRLRRRLELRHLPQCRTWPWAVVRSSINNSLVGRVVAVTHSMQWLHHRSSLCLGPIKTTTSTRTGGTGEGEAQGDVRGKQTWAICSDGFLGKFCILYLPLYRRYSHCFRNASSRISICFGPLKPESQMHISLRSTTIFR